MYMYLNYHHGNKLFPPQPVLQRKKGLLIFFNRKRLRELLKFLLVASDFLVLSINNCCSVTLSCLTLCSPISDAIQPSHPLMPFSPSALNLSQDQGLFQ